MSSEEAPKKVKKSKEDKVLKKKKTKKSVKKGKDGEEKATKTKKIKKSTKKKKSSGDGEEKVVKKKKTKKASKKRKGGEEDGPVKKKKKKKTTTTTTTTEEEEDDTETTAMESSEAVDEQPSEVATAETSTSSTSNGGGGDGDAPSADPAMDTTRVFLGNLPFDVDEATIYEFFKDCGQITDLYWVHDRKTNEFYGSAFITFASPKAVVAALKKDGTLLMEREINIKPGKPREAAPENTAWESNKPKKGGRELPVVTFDEADDVVPDQNEENWDNCRIFLGNLHFKIDEESLKKVFEPCGPVSDVHWVLDKATQKFYGTAFVTFETAKAARRAQTLAGRKVKGRPLKVGYATGMRAESEGFKKKQVKKFQPKPLGERPQGCYTLFLGNLAYDIDELAVKTAFEHCGEIHEIRWIEKDGEFQGCGFVAFEGEECLDEAIKLNGTDLLGRTLVIDYAPDGNSS